MRENPPDMWTMDMIHDRIQLVLFFPLLNPPPTLLSIVSYSHSSRTCARVDTPSRSVCMFLVVRLVFSTQSHLDEGRDRGYGLSLTLYLAPIFPCASPPSFPHLLPYSYVTLILFIYYERTNERPARPCASVIFFRL